MATFFIAIILGITRYYKVIQGNTWYYTTLHYNII